ncbi:MAG: hypothetical protein U9N47_04305 [Thermodesulfobacteriota bacterium]|nr:hypothetical protein [Thermodesulfobacteriota bacterium]
MKVDYNFITLVALGSFNPAIVSPDFLNTVCELNLGKPDDQSPPDIPVIRHLEFQNLEFTVEMNRLQIMEKGIENITETRVLSIFNVYHEKLPYTPLKAVGVNINCDLFAEMGTETDALAKKISDANTYLEFFGSNKINVTESSLQTKTDKTWMSSNYHIENVRGLTRSINVTQKKDFLNLNYNYEAGVVDKHKSNLSLLLDGYEQFCHEFLNFVKDLEG